MFDGTLEAYKKYKAEILRRHRELVDNDTSFHKDHKPEDGCLICVHRHKIPEMRIAEMKRFSALWNEIKR